MSRPQKDQELELSITNLAFGGRGVARLDGFVLFVEGAVPGDRVRAVVTKSRASFAEARALEILEASEARVEAPCRHFGVCGGCAWQSLSYETQLKYKQGQVDECLRRLGGQDGFLSRPALAAVEPWRYRNKVEFTFAGEQGVELGFHRPGEWWRVVDIEDCLLHSELTNRIRDRVREFVRASGVEVYDQRRQQGFWRHLVIREGFNTGEVMVNVVTAPGSFPGAERFARELREEFPRIASLVWSVNETRAAVAGGFPFTVLAGRDHILEKIAGVTLKVLPSTFLQTNTRMAELLYRQALAFAAPLPDERAFDLYCGVGSIALLLAKSCREVFGVEVSEDAIHLAEENAALNDITNVSFAAGKVRRVLKELPVAPNPDLVLLDPPRAGASRKEVERLAGLGAARLVYVSCNASTLAGNAQQLAAAGYRLDEAVAVDMFPQTPHIEVVARFDRTAEAAGA